MLTAVVCLDIGCTHTLKPTTYLLEDVCTIKLLELQVG